MKNLYLRLSIIIISVSASFILNAQVTITASSGNTGPVSYITLKAAFDAINLGTHTGDISILLSGNTTEVSSAILIADGQQSASYTSVTIKPQDGIHPVVSGNVQGAIIMLNGADNVLIDGSNGSGTTSKNLTISNTSTNGNSLLLVNGATNNTIINSIITSSETDWEGGTIVLAGSNTSSGNNYNTIENNDINGHAGSYPNIAVRNLGAFEKPNTGNVYRNNRIYDFAAVGFYDGTDFGEIGFSSKTLVDGNEFFSTVPQVNPAAILIWHPTGISEMTISNNTIHNLASTNSLAGITLLEAVSVIVKNNFISLSESNFELFGISQQTVEGADIKIYHNTVYLSGTASGAPSMAFLKNASSKDDEIYNNIFINNRLNTSADNYGQYAFVKVGSGTYTSDYNNLVSTGNSLNFAGNQGPNRYSTLDDWQTGTGQDLNSVSVMPKFVSASDLHVIPDSNMAIDNLGTPIADNETDIDGDIRSLSTPDIGADEFNSTVGIKDTYLDKSISTIALIPNLVSCNTTLQVNAQQNKTITWRMLDITGKIVMVFGQQISSGQNDLQLNLTDLAPGVYHIVGNSEKGSTTFIRFIKQ